MEELKLGLDLCDGYTRLSCWGQEKTWTMPTVACRKKEEDVWLVGEEAYASALMGDGVIVDKLLKLVLKDGTSTISGTKYRGMEILQRFLEKVLLLPAPEAEGPVGNWVAQLVVSVPHVEAFRLPHLLCRLFKDSQRAGSCD